MGAASFPREVMELQTQQLRLQQLFTRVTSGSAGNISTQIAGLRTHHPQEHSESHPSAGKEAQLTLVSLCREYQSQKITTTTVPLTLISQPPLPKLFFSLARTNIQHATSFINFCSLFFAFSQKCELLLEKQTFSFFFCSCFLGA